MNAESTERPTIEQRIAGNLGSAWGRHDCRKSRPPKPFVLLSMRFVRPVKQRKPGRSVFLPGYGAGGQFFRGICSSRVRRQPNRLTASRRRLRGVRAPHSPSDADAYGFAARRLGVARRSKRETRHAYGLPSKRRGRRLRLAVKRRGAHGAAHLTAEDFTLHALAFVGTSSQASGRPRTLRSSARPISSAVRSGASISPAT
jgi:hypothetical protein